MSKLTRCNYCNLRDYRHRAKDEGKRIVLRPSSFQGGINVFSVPKGISLPPPAQMIEPNDKYPNGNKAYEQYHIAWIGGLSDGCVC